MCGTPGSATMLRWGAFLGFAAAGLLVGLDVGRVVGLVVGFVVDPAEGRVDAPEPAGLVDGMDEGASEGVSDAPVANARAANSDKAEMVSAIRSMGILPMSLTGILPVSCFSCFEGKERQEEETAKTGAGCPWDTRARCPCHTRRRPSNIFKPFLT
jgi:hypothetical protein